MTGLIVLWSGAIVDIPNGWALCDGNNGTPDLRNRFIVGAGDIYNPGAAGGSNTHNHTGTTDVAYDSYDGETSEDNDCLESGDYLDSSPEYPDMDFCTQGHTHWYYGDTDGHDHVLYVNNENHLPPYYALAYIMKL